MSCDAFLWMVQTEIGAAEGRASMFAEAAQSRLRARADSTTIEHALFRELDNLIVLRAKPHALLTIEQRYRQFNAI